ncbi:unnamed protein product [Thlaspi arvense]|uniref:Uncharacterized protein n=1 Tax=Thlaspi arvense TaxID=13288 RepID=A0AAU9TA56_THLAR|nr:unnamed protein product [Thlaspi arvense]
MSYYVDYRNHGSRATKTYIRQPRCRSRHLREQVPKPISFGQDGTVVYPFMDENEHQYFNVCSCAACMEDFYEFYEKIRKRRRKKKDSLYKRYLEGDPTVRPLGDGKYYFIIKYWEKWKEHKIMMMQANNFPPYEDFTKDDIAHSPKILIRAINSSRPDQLS